MKYKLYYLLLIGFSFRSGAQVDTSFWFVAPDVSAVMGDTAIKLHFQSYDQPTVIYINQPANPAGISMSLALGANSIYNLNLSASLTAVESSPTNSVSNKGIYISSKEIISVYYSLGAATNREMVSLKGSRALGTDFYTPIPTSTAVIRSTKTVIAMVVTITTESGRGERGMSLIGSVSNIPIAVIISTPANAARGI